MLSIPQYLMLRYFSEHDVHVQHLRIFPQRTLAALSRKTKSRDAYLARNGTRIDSTNAGKEEFVAIAARLRGGMQMRKDADLTDRVTTALHISGLSIIRGQKKAG